MLEADAPAGVLRAEHVSIRRMIAVLRAVAVRVQEDEEFPAADVAVVLGFFRGFVELVHHQKEAAVLYPFAAMVAGEGAAEDVGALIADHDDSKLLLHSLTAFWEPGGLLAAERIAFAELARTYAQRLEGHMAIEEQRLFPLAETIPGDDQIRFVAEFERIAEQHRDHATWEAEIDRLESVYLL